MRILAILLIIAVAGCFEAGPAGDEEKSPPAEPARLDYVAIDEARLAPAVHSIGARQTDYIGASGEIRLFIEWWLPDDGPGPWPTILHSTPYSHLDRVGTTFGYRDTYVPKGYAVAVTDVRGFGESEGCVTVWGPEEQQDQYDVVEWIAAQPWSDGQVALIGVSYPGTTPIEAAVMAPPHLTTVVAVAGLTDPYFDWHFGGVPNSEPSGSPAAYFGIGAAPPQNVLGGQNWLGASAHGRCVDPPVVTESYRMDGLYTQYYKDRNFSARAADIQVPFLFSQGFSDSNVKPSQLLNFFNAIPTVKKGFFGQWAHSNPQRPDWGLMEQAWFDHWMLGLETGILDGPVVEVMTNLGTWRADTHFPPLTERSALWLDACTMTLRWEAPEMACKTPLQARTTEPAPVDVGPTQLVFESEPLPTDVVLSGEPKLRFQAAIDADNAFWSATLHDVGSASRQVSFGALNAALRDGYTTYKAVPQGQVIDYALPFQPREWIFEAGQRIQVTLSIDDALAAANPEAGDQVHATIHTGPDSSHVDMPVLPFRSDIPLPWES